MQIVIGHYMKVVAFLSLSRFFWVELLDHILMRETGTVNHLEAKGIDLRQITKSILIFLRSSNRYVLYHESIVANT